MFVKLSLTFKEIAQSQSMSEDKKLNSEPGQINYQNFEYNKMEYVEAWFDNHPEPWNIDCHLFSLGKTEIEIFFADQVFDTWMIKITCSNARRAVYYSKLLYKTTCQMDITQIQINKKLFLFKDLRF